MRITPSEQEQMTLLPLSDEEEPESAISSTERLSTVLTSRRYKKGSNEAQPLLLPPSVDDYVATDNPVRAIKVYVGTLNVKALGFKNVDDGLKAGQPAFDPADLLQLYLYGYLNRVRSSRRLAAECVRNLEVMWLLNGLRPGYHTIADFRKNNAGALKAANSHFVQLCRELALFGGKLIGIDGSFFNGDASHASVKTQRQLQSEPEATERDIERYQTALNDNDIHEADQPDDAVASAEKLIDLKARVKKKTEQIE